MEDQERMDWIWENIEYLDRKAATYTAPRSAVDSARALCNRQTDGWRASYNGLANNANLSQVKKVDAFEGEMADKLKSLVSDAMMDLSGGLAAAQRLVSALDSQLGRIDAKVDQLNTERWQWYYML